MLREMHIRNYAVIDNLTVEFHPGLNLLTGETGSGKSILVDALGLALGGRASTDVIRTGAERATVTAVFEVLPSSAERSPRANSLSAWLEEAGLGGGEEGEIILRREIQAAGKSRLLVNDQPVTVAAVKNLAPMLVEVHGQNEHTTLFSHSAQLDLLDQFAGAKDLVRKVGEIHARRRNLECELAGLNQSEQERLRRIDLLQFQIQELDRAALEPGEDSSLAAERQVLANLEKIRAAAAAAFGELYEEEGSANARLAGAVRHLEELRRYDQRFEPYSEPLAAAQATLDDLAFLLRDYLEKLQADPGRLVEVEDRLALIERLKRKYGGSLEEVLAFGVETRRQLSSLEHADERRGELARELEDVAATYRERARKLSQERRSAAKQLERLVREELAQVGMEKTRFEVHFAAAADRQSDNKSRRSEPVSSPGSATGIDDVEFLISPNPGEELRPLERIASGGELSRLMLALRTVVGQARGRSQKGTRGSRIETGAWSQSPEAGSPGPTFVFDEVDSGIGGRVAESVGQRLQRLACGAQVLCVTHLPQIACFADHHYYVEKLERAGRTVTTVTYLGTEKERAAELARMLSGSRITDAVLKHAAAMLKHAGEFDS